MKKTVFGIIFITLFALLTITALAKTHRTDIVAIDTIEYTLEEEDKLSAELFIEEDGLYLLKVMELSSTGSFKPNILISLYHGNKTVFSYETKRSALSEEEFNPEAFRFLGGLTEGEYRLEIENLTKFSDVSFKIETTFTEEENIETIENSSFEGTTVIDNGEKYFGGVSVSDDTDYFCFEMPYDGYAYIQMYSPELKFFTLFDEDKNEIGSIGIEIEESDKIYELRTGLAKGKYYISVSPDSDYIDPLYTIEVSAYEADGFEKEYNNRKETATSVRNNDEYQGNLFGIHDEDVYTFTLSENSNVAIDFTDTVVSKDGHYSIWLSDGENVIFSSDESGKESAVLSLDKGTYYFTVSSLGYSRFTSMAYKIKISSDKGFTENAVQDQESGVPEETVEQFSDVAKEKWYYEEILEARSLGLINGDGNNLYRPEQPVSVAEIIAMASRIKNSAGGTNTPLENSPVGKWYNSYVTFAANSGIIKSDDFDDFERNATRSEVAYIFANIFDEVEAVRNTIISDVDKSTKYCDEIHKLFALGIVNGDGNGNFRPDDSITRAEAAAILLRVHKTI